MPNRLSRETSPYLLQHADNPVEWYPWGEEALEKARSEDIPILLSIGYSACHWCHVMERESFEDADVAEVMNESFVNIKVDREERPDIDSVYMRAVQALTGRGGWPLTVFLTPEGVPYYGGTYFPPSPRQGMPSFRQILGAAGDAWSNRRDEVVEAAERLRAVLERSAVGEPPEGEGDEGGVVRIEASEEAAGPPAELLRDAYRSLAGSFDSVHGGFGGAPKFPQPVVLEFLLRYHRWSPERGDALDMVTHTLQKMAGGGMRDHLGGGFHRYSVDARWLVPHFEKMLYDNALLARVYLQAWQVTGIDGLRRVSTTTLEWILRDMRDPGGGFYSARDADSEGEEGLFYVWTPDELREVLEPEEARLFARVYDVSEGGNFEGRSILHLAHDPEAVARSEGLDPDEMERRLAAAREKLLAARAERVPPLRDDKVLAGWNGLTLRALAEAGGALGHEEYVQAAREGADFVLERMTTGGESDADRRLLHVWAAGEARIDGFLEDYAAMGNALLTLYEVTLEPRWLPEVRWLCRSLLEHFWDDDAGVFFDTARHAEKLVVRPRETMDNATPSGTSLAVELLLRAGHLLDEPTWREAGRRMLLRETPRMKKFPSAFGRLLGQALAWHEEPLEVALVGPRDDPALRSLLEAVLGRYLPQRTVAGREPGEELPVPVPLLEERELVEGRPTAYVCRAFACRQPVTRVADLEEELDELAGPDAAGTESS